MEPVNEFGFAPNGAPILTSKMTITVTVESDEAGRMKCDFKTDQPAGYDTLSTPFTSVLIQNWFAYHLRQSIGTFDMADAFSLYYEDIMSHRDKFDPDFVRALEGIRHLYMGVKTSGKREAK